RQNQEHAFVCAALRRVGGGEGADPVWVTEPAHRFRDPKSADEQQDADQRRESGTKQELWPHEVHGNLRRSHARRSASKATSTTPGISRKGNRSSNDAIDASKRVLSS